MEVQVAKGRGNRGASGIDAISAKGFGWDLDLNLAKLSRTRRSRSVEAVATREIEIPKSGGRTRELAMAAPDGSPCWPCSSPR